MSGGVATAIGEAIKAHEAEAEPVQAGLFELTDHDTGSLTRAVGLADPRTGEPRRPSLGCCRSTVTRSASSWRHTP